MTDAERTKLNGIASEANNYSHPASHPASMIEESTTRKFMTDAEKTLLSSLGTNAIQLESQNLWNEKAQNGYVKYSNGLLIQWGKKTSGGSYQGTIYFPVSFYNSYYSLCIGPAKGNVVDNSSWIANYTANKVGSFNYINTYSMGSSNNTSSAEFSWFAIGRWKL